MDTSFSVPPPAPAAVPAPAARPKPVGDLKRLDSKRVLAYFLDGAVLLPVSIVTASTQDEAIYLPLLLVTLIYYFLCEALTAQTVGKRVLGLRVMQRDGSAPTVNQVSVRTVLRLIDHSPLGLIVMLLSGKRRQRIGDLLAGTTVGPAVGPVPKPAGSPLLVIYPVGWLIGAIVWFAGTADARSEGEYLQQASAICATTADAWMPDISTSQWLAVLEAQQIEHAALLPPDSLKALHAELLAVGRTDIQLGRRFLAAERRGDVAAFKRVERRAHALNKRRQALGRAGLPACG
jgi:uncharacterized RDD family membrane protein YckC